MEAKHIAENIKLDDALNLWLKLQYLQLLRIIKRTLELAIHAA